MLQNNTFTYLVMFKQGLSQKGAEGVSVPIDFRESLREAMELDGQGMTK